MFFSMSVAKSLRMVPAAAFAGLVAPMISRFLAIAFSPSSTISTTGPEVMKLHQVLEEGPRLVDGVEALGLALRQVLQPDRDGLEALLLEAGDDLADDALLESVRLDDGERALDGHGRRVLVPGGRY